ncbi:hypothetical protein KPL40_00400 [Clostridium gasigenes]|nr:hypothetical protein [Clostridium gasigenes]MBU3130900.1 hypothetical protein [Clostridium gasigenes]
MFQKSIISKELSIDKFFNQLNFDLYLTKPQSKHIKNIINTIVVKGFNGKVSDVAALASPRHRTSITRFLSSSN